MIHSSRPSNFIVSRRDASRCRAIDNRRRGFTLIEILVALALFMIMLAIVFIPMNLGINMFHIGKARSEAQGAAVSTMNQMEGEIRRAIYIYPNDALPGVTDQVPYTSNKKNSTDLLGYPYIQTPGPLTSSSGACDRFNASMTVPERVVGNTARLEMLVPRLGAKGAVQTPVTPDYYLVSYYARRLKADKPFDIIDNPIVLYRAQIPYRRTTDGAPFQPDTPPALITLTGARNVDTSLGRYSNATDCSSSSTVPNRNSLWLTQSNGPTSADPNQVVGEPNLEPLCYSTNTDSRETATPVVEGTHTLATPRGMALVARTKNGDQAQGDLKGVAFLCADSDGDGKIDRVTINLSVGQYDSAGGSTRNGQGSAQSAQLSQTVELTNNRHLSNIK